MMAMIRRHPVRRRKRICVATTACALALVVNLIQIVSIPSAERLLLPIAGSQNDKTLRLQVPFYVYEESNLNWENHTFVHQGLPDYETFKHSDDLWLYRASLRHPMRTNDPEKAKLFFVPFFLNTVSAQKTCLNVNATSKVCFQRPGQAYQFANLHLGSSKYFQRSQGRDHVIVISFWLKPLTRKIENLLSCNLINFEGHIPLPNPDRFFIPSFYVGYPCPTLEQKIYDFVMVATFRPLPEFQSRKDICQWLDQGEYSVSACGQGEQCPAVAQAKYGFHARGDTLGSNRVMDLVLSRTIPLFTDSDQYDVLPDFVPWRKLSYLMNASNHEAFTQSITSLLSQSDAEYLEKLLWIEKYIHIFDHRQVYQFDAYMAEFAKKLSLQ